MEFRRYWLFIALGLVLGGGVSVNAQQTLYWRNAASGSWSTASNWNDTDPSGLGLGPAPTDQGTVIFNQTSGTITSTMDLTLGTGASQGLYSIRFNDTFAPSATSSFIINLSKPLTLTNALGSAQQIYVLNSASGTINVTFNLSGANNIALNTDAEFKVEGNRTLLIANPSNNSSLALGSHNLTLHAFTTGSRIRVDAPITGTGGVTVTGQNTSVALGDNIVTLAGANTYTGATQVTGGVLNVLGSIASSSSVTVNTLSNLAGTGTTSSVLLSGRITPGNALNARGAATSIGNLTVNGNLAFNSGGSYLWELGNATGGVPGTSWDLITVTGTLSTLTGTKTILIDNLDAGWALTNGRAYKIIGTSSAVSQALANTFTLAFGPGGSAAWGGVDISHFHLEGRADGLYLVETPEAAWYAAGALALAVGAACRRRRAAAA